MSKKKIEKLQKEYTKPQLSHWEKQHRRQRYILFGGIGLIAIIVLGLVAAWFFQQIWPLYKTVIDVNGQKITMSQYITSLKAISKGQGQSNMASNAMQLDSMLTQSEILRQGAAAQKITVTDDEVNAELQKNSLDKGWAPIVRANLLADKMKSDYFKPQVPTTADQCDIEAMFLESDTQASDIRAQLEAGASFSDLATANSLDSYSQTNKGEIGWHTQQVFEDLLGSTVPGDYAFASDVGSLSQPRPDTTKEKTGGYWLITVIEKGTGDKEGQVNVRAMLLGSEEEANQVRSDIVDNGQDFSTLANEKSQYDTGGQNGGLIGYISKGTMSTAFDDVAFNLAVGEISQPVKDTSQTTKGGFWLIKVVDSAKGKEISADDITTLTDDLFNAWFSQAQSSAKVNDLLTYAIVTWAISKVTGS